MMNEDRSMLRIGTTKRGEPYAVAVIADGVGGSGDGEKASETAFEIIRGWLDRELKSVLRDPVDWDRLDYSVQRLFHAINEKLLMIGNRAGSQVSTTLTLLFLLNETFFLCHTGDCRIYRFNGSRLRQITKDQSWVSSQVRLGRLTQKQAQVHPKRHILLHCLGVSKELNLYRRTGFYTKNSLFLLCSDGLYNRLSDLEVERFLTEQLQSGADMQLICDKIVDKALDKRSPDNISAVLLQSLDSHFNPLQRAWHRAKNIDKLFPVEWRKWYNKLS
ncbi:serine/threonine-protein phosphatase [Paenibacillus sp. H1-7]|uniref:PP2C family protein-serine/threonine phosphatase n=1 Tax=Paenibacillus sp. H1-7 TaxID=2282849 RepID=UPI001EF8F43B|nr:PP2C family serine/threonine-protein phosphatase [Paenibacillus sp. H1-7]ULL15745.1 serine/threonine-protein phosphatase [Paenibacillus sp. H1-7]